MQVDPKLTKEQFCERFKARMISLAGEKFDDGKSIAEYADMTSPTYFGYFGDGESPEECADGAAIDARLAAIRQAEERCKNWPRNSFLIKGERSGAST